MSRTPFERAPAVGGHDHAAKDLHSLWLVPVDGTASRRLVSDATAAHAAWSRDGRSIVFTHDGELVTLALATRERRPVAAVTQLNGVAWG